MVVGLGGMAYYLSKQSEKIQESENVKLERELDIFGENNKKFVKEERKISEIYTDTNVQAPKVVYSKMYSENQTKQVKDKKKKNLYDFESPLWEWNLYGTNELSIYLYFKTTEATSIQYTIQVEDDTIPNFTRTLYNGEEDNLTREHEYQLVGLVPGTENLICLEMYGKDKKLLNKKVFSLDVPELTTKVEKKISVSSGRSDEQISNGLYTIFSENAICLYDNSGCIRSVFPLLGTTSQKIYRDDQEMYYGVNQKQIVKINALGAVEEVYSLGKYNQYEDFIYNGYGEFWILATKPGKKSKSVKDTVISLNLKNKKVEELFCMEDLLPEMKKRCTKEKGKKLFDWINLTGLTQVKSDEVIVSSRELSTLFKITNINSREPRISYLTGEKQIWKGTIYEKKLLDKKGQSEADEALADEQEESILDLGEAEQVFISQYGPTWISLGTGEELSESQYYLYVWDSNYGNSPTRPKFKWKQFKGIGLKNRPAKASFLKTFLVDENTAVYDLVETKELAYTKEQGSTLFYKNHRIDSRGEEKEYAEYDSTGRMIRKFTHTIKNVLRIEKMDMKEFWFY